MKDKGIFIAVEGPIGVGKTTLSNILTEYFNCTSLREIVEENPFLSNFYKDIKEYALQTESFFLFNRIKQLEDVQATLDAGQSVISDYHIIKNLIFAGITLNCKEFHRYRQVYNIFVPDLPQPDIIIYLNSSIDVLMNRISMRDRSFERQMDVNYLKTLSEEYSYYFDPISIKHNFVNKTPLVVSINNSKLDVLNNADDRAQVIRYVEEAIESLGGKN